MNFYHILQPCRINNDRKCFVVRFLAGTFEKNDTSRYDVCFQIGIQGQVLLFPIKN